LCQNPYCSRRTFSVLPQEVMPYCRFLWPDMVKVSKAITEGKSYYYIAHNLFSTAIANCVRLGNILSCLTSWINTLCQEHDDYNHISGLKSGVNILMKHYSWTQLKHMWSRFFYPKTFLKGVINIV
jgi:hypothetical protein